MQQKAVTLYLQYIESSIWTKTFWNFWGFLHLCHSKPVFPFIHGRKRKLFEECSCCSLQCNAILRAVNPVLQKHKIRYQISWVKSLVFIFCFFLTTIKFMSFFDLNYSLRGVGRWGLFPDSLNELDFCLTTELTRQSVQGDWHLTHSWWKTAACCLS